MSEREKEREREEAMESKATAPSCGELALLRRGFREWRRRQNENVGWIKVGTWKKVSGWVRGGQLASSH